MLNSFSLRKIKRSRLLIRVTFGCECDLSNVYVSCNTHFPCFFFQNFVTGNILQNTNKFEKSLELTLSIEELRRGASNLIYANFKSYKRNFFSSLNFEQGPQQYKCRKCANIKWTKLRFFRTGFMTFMPYSSVKGTVHKIMLTDIPFTAF